MPMHDWTRIDPNEYHDFHGAWIYAIRHVLNGGLLPPDYYALAEQWAGPVGPDVLTLERPDPDSWASGPAHGTALATAPVASRFTVAAKPKPLKPTPRRLAVRHTSGNRMVAVVEIVSPTNKRTGKGFGRFLDKAVGLIDQDVHLLVVDPFPPTRRDPNGVHGAIWKRLTGKSFELPPETPLTVAAYAAPGEDEIRVKAFVTPLAVGEAVPAMPLFLTPGTYVSVPLDATYDAAFRDFPKHLKAVLEVGTPDPV